MPRHASAFPVTSSNSLPARLRLPLQAAVAALLGAGTLGAAYADPAQLPITDKQKQTAQQVAQAGVPLSELAPNAPDRYTVKKGDTLWSISTLFLKSPWRWPELWGMNLEQIRNPHLIYPGQTLVLERVGDRAVLRVEGAEGGTGPSGRDRLQPRVREESLGPEAITTIPSHLIDPFLTEAVILNAGELDRAPRLVGMQEGRHLATTGDRVYARGTVGSQREWRIFRDARPLKDPETQAVLGYEASVVGLAELQSPGQAAQGKDGLETPSSLRVLSSRREAGAGDRLAALEPQRFERYAPHAPAKFIRGSIIAPYEGGRYTGGMSVVSINRGRADGMEVGHVLAAWRAGRVIEDVTAAKRGEKVQLPDERSGLLMVFRVFDRTSYALVVRSDGPIGGGDRITSP